MSNKQLIPSVKGTRDFYPKEMAFRNWLYGKIKAVSEKFGYQEYDGPEIEYLSLYADKTSEEILKEQAFNLKDRDGRDILLRPELTPTLARMIAQQGQELLKPIRWYSFGRCWRYEQPQKGRAREFFQWEIDIIGIESPEADAEILAVAAEYFKQLGLTSDEVIIRVSDRSWLQSELNKIGVDNNKLTPLLRILDRKDKLSKEDFEKTLQEQGLSQNQIKEINNLMSETNYSKSPLLKQVFDSLKNYDGVLPYIQFDPNIIRGFDYYTGVVFEAWDKTGNLKRALFGGGRFDNLTATLGGEKISATGMAPGNMPIEEILKQFNKMPNLKPKTALVLVTVFSKELFNKSLEVASQLRSNNIDSEVYLDQDMKLDKQLKYADQKEIPYVLIIGPDEASQNKVTLKNLSDKLQQILTLDEVIQKLSS